MNYVSEAFEKQMDALAFLSKCYKYPQMRPGVSQAERKMWRTDIHALSRAVPYYWNAQTTEIVSTMMPSFKLEDITCSRNMVHSDVGWCYFPDKAPFEVKEYNTDTFRPIRAITWYLFREKDQPYLGMTGWCPTIIEESTNIHKGPLSPAIWACIWLGQPMSIQIQDDVTFMGYVDERTIQEIVWLRQFVIAANTFMRQEIFSVKKEPLQRHARKRLGIDKLKVPLINVVHLRKVHPRKNEDAEPRDIDWQWQWTVAGHVRSQWYPTLGEHLPVLIHPYGKGPVDKPMKPRTTPIYAVTR